MKKEFFQEIEFPEDVSVTFSDGKLTVKGPQGENSRIFKIGKLNLEVKGKKILLGCEKSTKNDKRLTNTITAHIKNMIQGVKEKFEYQLKVCSSHFPMSLEIKGNEILIKNFLGEKIARKSKVFPGSEVKIDKNVITVTSLNKETAGHTAASLETATRISGRDRRIFQDGIYITKKCGRAI